MSVWCGKTKRATTQGRPYGVGTSCAPFRRYEGRKQCVVEAPNACTGDHMGVAPTVVLGANKRELQYTERMINMIAIGCDHGAYELKLEIIRHLKERGFKVKDFGCGEGEKADYPDIAFPVAESVASGECERGILCCGTGIGMCIAANKVRGIRAAVVTEPTSAGLTKEHNNSNIICFGGRITGPVLALESLDAWLYSEYMGGRHQGRIDKIAQYEERK